MLSGLIEWFNDIFRLFWLDCCTYHRILIDFNQFYTHSTNSAGFVWAKQSIWLTVSLLKSNIFKIRSSVRYSVIKWLKCSHMSRTSHKGECSKEWECCSCVWCYTQLGFLALNELQIDRFHERHKIWLYHDNIIVIFVAECWQLHWMLKNIDSFFNIE